MGYADAATAVWSNMHFHSQNNSVHIYRVDERTAARQQARVRMCPPIKHVHTCAHITYNKTQNRKMVHANVRRVSATTALSARAIAANASCVCFNESNQLLVARKRVQTPTRVRGTARTRGLRLNGKLGNMQCGRRSIVLLPTVRAD